MRIKKNDILRRGYEKWLKYNDAVKSIRDRKDYLNNINFIYYDRKEKSVPKPKLTLVRNPSNEVHLFSYGEISPCLLRPSFDLVAAMEKQKIMKKNTLLADIAKADRKRKIMIRIALASLAISFFIVSWLLW